MFFGEFTPERFKKEVENTKMAKLYEIIQIISVFCFTFAKYVVGFLLLFSSIIMVVQVILRYAFNSPLGWVESAVKIMLEAMVFLTAGMVLRKRGHMFVSLLIDRFPQSVRKAGLLISDSAILFFFILFSIYGYLAATQVQGIIWEFGNLPKMWLVMILPIGGVFISIQALCIVLEDILEKSLTKDDLIKRQDMPIAAL